MAETIGPAMQQEQLSHTPLGKRSESAAEKLVLVTSSSWKTEEVSARHPLLPGSLEEAIEPRRRRPAAAAALLRMLSSKRRGRPLQDIKAPLERPPSTRTPRRIPGSGRGEAMTTRPRGPTKAALRANTLRKAAASTRGERRSERTRVPEPCLTAVPNAVVLGATATALGRTLATLGRRGVMRPSTTSKRAHHRRDWRKHHRRDGGRRSRTPCSAAAEVIGEVVSTEATRLQKLAREIGGARTTTMTWSTVASEGVATSNRSQTTTGEVAPRLEEEEVARGVGLRRKLPRRVQQISIARGRGSGPTTKRGGQGGGPMRRPARMRPTRTNGRDSGRTTLARAASGRGATRLKTTPSQRRSKRSVNAQDGGASRTTAQTGSQMTQAGARGT